jgi:hypothetical protein
LARVRAHCRRLERICLFLNLLCSQTRWSITLTASSET